MFKEKQNTNFLPIQVVCDSQGCRKIDLFGKPIMSTNDEVETLMSPEQFKELADRIQMQCSNEHSKDEKFKKSNRETKIITRKEQIRNAAEFYSKKNKITPIPYLDFIEAAEWADRTMIEKMYLWLEDNIDKYTKAVLHSNGDGKLEEKIILIKSFKKDFIKAMEE